MRRGKTRTLGASINLRAKVEANIRKAFAGVWLGQGISLKQAQVVDKYGEGTTKSEFVGLKRSEITQDWEKVPFEELEGDCVAHLDAEGIRYYIPALMLSVLNHYESASMRVIGTIAALYPEKEHWNYHMQRYSLLSEEQKAAIASFLQALPEMVELEVDDSKRVARALKNYWAQFLSRKEIHVGS